MQKVRVDSFGFSHFPTSSGKEPQPQINQSSLCSHFLARVHLNASAKFTHCSIWAPQEGLSLFTPMDATTNE